MSTDIRTNIEALFIYRQREWEKQGRSPDEKWAVMNFRTGQGELFFNDLVKLVERERFHAVANYMDTLTDLDGRHAFTKTEMDALDTMFPNKT